MRMERYQVSGARLGDAGAEASDGTGAARGMTRVGRKGTPRAESRSVARISERDRERVARGSFAFTRGTV